MKLKWLLGLSTIPVAIAGVVALSAKYDNISNNEMVSFLEGDDQWSEEKFNQVAFEAKKDEAVLNWIKSVDFSKNSYEDLISSLYRLNTTKENKQFLFMNLKEKIMYKKMMLANSGDIKNLNNQVSNSPSNVNVQMSQSNIIRYVLDSDKNAYVDKYDGQKRFLSGENWKEWRTIDWFLADDQSWLAKNNQTILSEYYASHNAQMVSLLKEYQETVNRFNNNRFMKEVSGLVKTAAYSAVGSIPGASVITNVSSLIDSSVDAVVSLSNDVRAAQSKGNSLRQFLISKGIRSKKLLDLANSFNSNNFNALAKFTTFTSVTSNVTSIASSVVSLASTGFGPGGVAVGSAVNVFINSVNVISQTIQAILSIPTPNGYTIGQNMHDHGLNDFNFQWLNNIQNMTKIQMNWSENLRKGIIWYVTDGWFTYPKLFIKTQGEGDNKYVEFNNFNWGHKVNVR